MPVNGSVLELLNVSAGYGPEPAIRGIDLAVRPGEFVGLVGPNGSGKSTLLKAALGLLPLRSGEVRLFGTPLGAFRDWRRVGYVPQQVAAIGAAFPASVREVVTMGRYSHAGPLRPFSRDDQSAVREAMERTGIDRFGRKLVNELSGGERQRVFLARALAGRPDLLLLDEPTASIDPDGRVQLTQLIGALNRERGVTVVFVSHDLPLLRGHLTRVVLINRTILFEGSPDELERRAEFGVFLEEAHHFEHVIRGED